jgi:ABC-type Fe3+ transport system permease subunit
MPATPSRIAALAVCVVAAGCTVANSGHGGYDPNTLRIVQSASEMAFRAFPATLQLAVTTMLLAIVAAVVIGCWAAYRPNSLADRFSSLLSMTAGFPLVIDPVHAEHGAECHHPLAGAASALSHSA